MDEMASSNLVIQSKEAQREKALAAWRFTTSSTSKEKEKEQGWNIVEASQRDMEFVVRALQRELNSGPRADHVLVNHNNIFTERTSNKNTDSDNSDEALPKKLVGKKRGRERGKSPVTVVAADPVHFRTIVQQATGGKNSGTATTGVLKPQPKRPFLPPLDASFCLNSNAYFPVPFSFPGAGEGLYNINDLPSWDGVPLYSPGLAGVSVGVPSPSLMPSVHVNYGDYLNLDATATAPETFMDAHAASIWNNGSKFS